MSMTLFQLQCCYTPQQHMPQHLLPAFTCPIHPMKYASQHATGHGDPIGDPRHACVQNTLWAVVSSNATLSECPNPMPVRQIHSTSTVPYRHDGIQWLWRSASALTLSAAQLQLESSFHMWPVGTDNVLRWAARACAMKLVPPCANSHAALH
jgi:hypothetical protein